MLFLKTNFTSVRWNEDTLEKKTYRKNTTAFREARRMAVSALGAEPAILVVEDDPLLGTEITNVLERLNFKITGIASTAHEAWDSCQTGKSAHTL